MKKSLIILSQRLGHHFHNITLLESALTHRSYGVDNNERLEFLGDSLLNLFIAEKLFSEYPELTEGELSRLRSNLVNGEILAVLAEELAISQYLRLGPGEIKSGGLTRTSILSNSIEALIGAIYLDAGMERCKECVFAWFANRISMAVKQGAKKDPKTILQEYLQRKKAMLPEYTVITMIGKDHSQLFEVKCQVAGFKKIALGKGANRKKAEQDAAENFLALIDQTHEK